MHVCKQHVLKVTAAFGDVANVIFVAIIDLRDCVLDLASMYLFTFVLE